MPFIPVIPFCTAATASSASIINSKQTDMSKIDNNTANMLSNNYPFKINGGKIITEEQNFVKN